MPWYCRLLLQADVTVVEGRKQNDVVAHVLATAAPCLYLRVLHYEHLYKTMRVRHVYGVYYT